jgi:DNA-binding MarR family transcriptional regulator
VISVTEKYEITWLIRRLFRSMAQRSNESLADWDLNATDRAVMEFLSPDLSLSVPEIAERYDVSRQHVQVTVNRLVEKKLLAIASNPRHKRSSLVHLTPRGKSTFKKILLRDKQLVNRLFSEIPMNNIHITKRTLEKLYERLNKGEL